MNSYVHASWTAVYCGHTVSASPSHPGIACRRVGQTARRIFSRRHGQDDDGCEESDAEASVRVTSATKERRLSSTNHHESRVGLRSVVRKALVEWEEGAAGKWCVFRHSAAIDEAWLAIRRAVQAGRLPLAKVSTRLTSPWHGHAHVICIYNQDWRDDAAITDAREVLRELGFTEQLGFKRDIETSRGVYDTADE